MVSLKQLWGGKIIAALDRQHPRDLFDIRNLMNEVSYSADIKEGFIFFLLCSKRPMQELLKPRHVDQHAVFESQFKGMTDVNFTYDEFENTREIFIKTVNESLTKEDKEFLLTFSNGEPDWAKVNYSQFPAVRWKFLSINKLKDVNIQKHKEQMSLLEDALFNV